MTKRTACLSMIVVASVASATPPMTIPTNAPTNATTPSGTISVQEMLVIGHSGLRLHSLAMITQGNVKGGVDESFMPGFKACAKDKAVPVRSITARVMGQNLVAGLDNPNPEAVELLKELARDESSDVRFNAVYHGLAQLNHKSDEVVALLLDLAASQREHSLYDRIVESMEDSRERVTKLLDKKLETEDSIALFEIYEDMTGKQPANSEKFLAMPSSRPKMFIFKGGSDDVEAHKSKLAAELKKTGIENPDLFVSGSGTGQVLLLKTYLTKDRIAVEKTFAGHADFKIMQTMWLTPEMELQFDAMREKTNEGLQPRLPRGVRIK